MTYRRVPVRDKREDAGVADPEVLDTIDSEPRVNDAACRLRLHGTGADIMIIRDDSLAEVAVPHATIRDADCDRWAGGKRSLIGSLRQDFFIGLNQWTRSDFAIVGADSQG